MRIGVRPFCGARNVASVGHRVQACHTVSRGGSLFGRLYYQRDRAVARAAGTPVLSVGAYACLVLAELLDRAETLATARTAAGADDAESVLARAVDLFLLDAEEARTRGLRARLFCRVESGGLDPWSVDPTDMLEDLGGELVPAGPIASAIATAQDSPDTR